MAWCWRRGALLIVVATLLGVDAGFAQAPAAADLPALTARLDLDQFAMLDLAYAPPFAPVWDPLLTAARQLRKVL